MLTTSNDKTLPQYQLCFGLKATDNCGRRKAVKKSGIGEERFSDRFFVPRRLPFVTYGERDTFIRLASR